MPFLQDKIYGIMEWREWEDDLNGWFGRITDSEKNEFMMFIYSSSQMNFWAARNTHGLYEKYISEIPEICRMAVDYVLRINGYRIKRRYRNRIGGNFYKNLRLVSIEFYEDLGCRITIELSLIEEADSIISAFFDPKGEFIEAYIDEN